MRLLQGQPLPRAAGTEVAAAAGQGHSRVTLGVTVSLWGSKLALKHPQELPQVDPP